MKNRFLLVLPLAASMMIPAVAQQTSSDQTQNQQPAAAAPASSSSTQSSDTQATVKLACGPGAAGAVTVTRRTMLLVAPDRSPTVKLTS